MVLVLKNESAGRSASPSTNREIQRLLKRTLGGGGTLFATSSLAELERLLPQLSYGTLPRALILWGGDGSLCALLSLLRQRGLPCPPICPLPGGTINVIAGSLGLSGDPLRQLERILIALAQDRARQVQRTAIVVEERLRTHVGFLFGLGLIPRFLSAYYARGASPKAARSLLGKLALEAIRRGEESLVDDLFAPFGATVSLDGVEFCKGVHTSISAGGVPDLGLGFAPYVRALERPGAFHLIAHRLAPAQALVQLPRIRLGLGMTGVREDLGTLATIETETPLPYALDGEVIPPEPDAREPQRILLRALPNLALLLP